jgi:hypothetical protein
MKTYGGVKVFLQIFVPGTRWGSALRPGRFTPGERAPDTHLTELLVDPRDGLNAVE